jgi:hypothetical protein
MVHPLRSAPVLVLTAIAGMMALPNSAPARFESPTLQEEDPALPIGTGGSLDPARPVSLPSLFQAVSDDAGRQYRLQTRGSQVSLLRSSGNRMPTGGGRVPASSVADARPFLFAHGNGRVFYLVREASAMAHPLGLGSGSGFGAGQSVIYASYDGGLTFDAPGYTLKDSGRCRGAADHTPLSAYLYVVCASATAPGTVWAYVSSDDGHSFERHEAGTTYAADEPSSSWPGVAVSPDGTVWALHVEHAAANAGHAASDVVRLLRSRDRGRTWTSEDITPLPGRYESASLALSPDGRRFGLGVYFKPSPAAPWRVYGAVWIPGTAVRLVSIDESHPAEPGLTGSVFDARGRLSVAWTRRGSEIFVARSN